MYTVHFTAIQLRITKLWHCQPPAAEGEDLMGHVVENHLHNFLIWHEEDIARRDDLPPERIRQAKRTIDRHNQWRNDAIEAMDAALLALLPPPGVNAPLHSESPGMMLDRLSILALREYHLEELCNTAVVAAAAPCGSACPVPVPAGCTAERQAGCAAIPGQRPDVEVKLRFVREQREWLTRTLDELLNAPGGVRFFPFRACKLYNDAATNPQMRAAISDATPPQ